MKVPTKLRFLLGIARHPSQVRSRIRELYRISTVSKVERSVPVNRPVQVDVIPVTRTDALGDQLVKIYADNPSPFVSGPTNLRMLARGFEKGVRYYLVVNGDGETVGARAFESDTKRLVGSVTDFPHRGKGYQINAAAIVRKRLAEEGFNVFHCEVMRDNERQLRKMASQGWEMKPHATKSDILCGVLRVNDESQD